MEIKDFEMKVLTDLASIKEMLKDYTKLKEDSSNALNLSSKNEQDIKEIKDKMKFLGNTITTGVIGIVIAAIVFVIKMMK